MIRFYVQGIPKSMKVNGVARFMRAGKQHMVPKRGNDEWVTVVGKIGRDHAPPVPLDGPVAFTALFYFPQPKSAKRRVFHLVKPDLDNCLHKLTDQFNGVFWADDSQVIDLVARKRYALDGRPGVEIIVEPVVVQATLLPAGATA